eukprot:5169978-Amphidinium_carterae.1
MWGRHCSQDLMCDTTPDMLQRANVTMYAHGLRQERTLHFLSAFLTGGAAPTMPLIKVEKSEAVATDLSAFVDVVMGNLSKLFVTCYINCKNN